MLATLSTRRGAPVHLRSDNGPEFVALAVQAWLKTNAIGALHIAPGSPWGLPCGLPANGPASNRSAFVRPAHDTL